MLFKRLRIPIIVFLTLVTIFLWFEIRYFRTEGQVTKIVFLDVGQGDAILITRGTNQILIDGGPGGRTLLAGVGKYVPFWDRTIEVVISTHPDADHIGGLPDLFRAYRVGTYVETGATSESDTFIRLREALDREHAVEIHGNRGLAFVLPGGGRFSVLAPVHAPPYQSSNDGSLVTRFSFGSTDFLFTGDLAHEERALPDAGESEVLKVAHHGSGESTALAFLDIVRPREAVISVGENRYGHPDPDVLGRLGDRGIIVRRTDEGGDIVYRCVTVEAGCSADD